MCANRQTIIFTQPHVQNNLLISLSLNTLLYMCSHKYPYPVAKNAKFIQVQIHWCYSICAFISDKVDRRNKRRTNRILLLKSQVKDTLLNITINLTLICLKCCSQASRCYLQRNKLNWDVALKQILFFFKLRNQKLLNAIERLSWSPWRQWKSKTRPETIQLGNSPTTHFHVRREVPQRFLLKHRLNLASMYRILFKNTFLRFLMNLWKLRWIGTVSKNIPLLEEVLKIVFVSVKMEAAFQIT